MINGEKFCNLEEKIWKYFLKKGRDVINILGRISIRENLEMLKTAQRKIWNPFEDTAKGNEISRCHLSLLGCDNLLVGLVVFSSQLRH